MSGVVDAFKIIVLLIPAFVWPAYAPIQTLLLLLPDISCPALNPMMVFSDPSTQFSMEYVPTDVFPSPVS